jgi:hypothetical protein
MSGAVNGRHPPDRKAKRPSTLSRKRVAAEPDATKRTDSASSLRHVSSGGADLSGGVSS